MGLGNVSGRVTRRRLLKDTTTFSAAAVASTLLPPNVRRALAQEPQTPGSLRRAKHVVMLVQENRSFDHAGLRVLDDPDALKLPNGRSVFYQPDSENPDGYVLSFHLDTHTSSAHRIPSTTHAWSVRFDDPARKPPALPDISSRLSLARYESTHLPKPVVPGANQPRPAQEKGRRKRVPLDYDVVRGGKNRLNVS